jgi:hypothetical protein
MTGQTKTSGIVARDVCKSFGTHLVQTRSGLTAMRAHPRAAGSERAGKTKIVRILSTLI